MTREENESSNEERELVIFKCESCGDTFPAHGGDQPACPTCKSEKVHEAHEPLL